MNPPSLGRRRLLGGIAGTGAAAALGISPSAASAAGTASLPSTVDVVVVGGGISGLVAARDLTAVGRLSGMSVQDSGSVRVSFDNCPPDAAVGVLMAFLGGATWRNWGNRPAGERRDAVLRAFATAFGPQALSPIDYVEHDWTHEWWSLGGPVAIAGVGTVYGDGPAAHRTAWSTGPARKQRPTGRNTWTAPVSAGKRAAAEVLQ